MLKIRIIPTLLYKDFGLVKGIQFDSWRRIGGVTQSVKVYNLRGVDELIFLDIKATSLNHHPDFDLVDEIADECFMPLTVGGGIRTIEDIRRLLSVGADKVSINTQAVLAPDFIRLAAESFGSQCITVSIDVKKNHQGQDEVFIFSGAKATGLSPLQLARQVELLGAGEILLTSIDRDGTMRGYDLELIREVAGAVAIPVIASGGAGNYEHLASAISEGGACAVAAASMFHFTEQTPQEAKIFLQSKGIDVRL